MTVELQRSSLEGQQFGAELGLRAQLLTKTATTWTFAKLGDPVARLMHNPWRDNPYPIYELLRERGPFVPSRLGVLAVTDYAVCEEVLKDPRLGVRTSSGTYGDPISHAVGLPLSLLELDPPDHTRLRRIAAPTFRPRKLEQFRERIEHVADTLADEVGRRAEFDFIDDFARPLPIRVITDLLGLDEVDANTLAAHGAVMAGALDGVRTIKQLQTMRRSVTAMYTMFTELIDRRRRAPGSDIVSTLVTALDDDRISAEELVQMCNLLLVAGFETTVNLIGNTGHALLTHPDQWSLLRAEPDRAAATAEETLRWDPPVQAVMRVVHEPVDIAGRHLRTDTVVLVWPGGASRDPAVHDRPAEFDIARPHPERHLAFSGGIHYCLGAPLARMEAEIALRVLATRMPGLRRTGPVVRRPTTIVHGFQHIPVTVN